MVSSSINSVIQGKNAMRATGVKPKMKVFLANPRGFCAGVHMAIDSLDLAIREFGGPIYVYHEIVHNKYVVEMFQEKGAVFVTDLESVPPGSYLLFSAHGVSPEIRRIARDRNLSDRCNLPTCYQGAFGGDPVCESRLHNHPYRT